MVSHPQSNTKYFILIVAAKYTWKRITANTDEIDVMLHCNYMGWSLTWALVFSGKILPMKRNVIMIK